jgi:hypothetical protein
MVDVTRHAHTRYADHIGESHCLVGVLKHERSGDVDRPR